MIFLPLSAQNPNFLSFLDRKAGTFFDQKMLKPLSVNALRVNQQALFKLTNQGSQSKKAFNTELRISWMSKLYGIVKVLYLK
ncbi:MAG: hypothetical protein F6J99_07975 [Moorea sp. SIO4G3]|nr:hypothetical protein [Moorena sp. SIO4G3]